MRIQWRNLQSVQIYRGKKVRQGKAEGSSLTPQHKFLLADQTINHSGSWPRCVGFVTSTSFTELKSYEGQV
ncbi:hypothetical protein J6590_016343 [Homalodisca vitripennis]|nr:hypothetical protein J6590_016343 [Homalodisca vitripennis]